MWTYLNPYQWVQYIIHTHVWGMFFPWASSNDDFQLFLCIPGKMTRSNLFRKSFRYVFYIFSHIVVNMTATVICDTQTCSWWKEDLECCIKSTPKDGCLAAIGTCLNHIMTLRSMYVCGYCQIYPSLLYFVIYGKMCHKYILLNCKFSIYLWSIDFMFS